MDAEPVEGEGRQSDEPLLIGRGTGLIGDVDHRVFLFLRGFLGPYDSATVSYRS